LIGGPTASGKSRIAIELCDQIPCEIINADSRQIYRNLSIGTSQPDEEQRRRVPHHLYGFLNPDQFFTAADYERLVAGIISEISTRKRLPVLVGGTGFYMKAVLRGVWPVPAKSPELRYRLRQIESKHQKNFLYNMLVRLDPASAAEVAPPDTYRIIRALEIYFQSGIRRSELPKTQEERYDALKYFLDPQRQQLQEDIEARTDWMFQNGWVQEVERLLTEYPDFERMPAAKSLGYPEIIRYIHGEITIEDCRNTIVLKTRQYAKRQLTWFRNQDQFDALPSGEPLHKIIDCVLQWYRN
jgi:tRNA dimethylallyltransferase